MKIILTESQYNLLLETDKRSIIVDKLGFSPEWADEFHNMSNKYAIWIANSFLNRYKKSAKEKTLAAFNETTPANSKIWNLPGSVKSSYEYILDWLKSPRREFVDMKSLTYDGALEEATDWHENLSRKSEQNYKETNEIIIDYRNAKGVGYYWANLGTSYSKEECDRMGHCGRGRGQLFSFRSINSFGEGQSYLTADYNNGVIRDFKASGNEHPSVKYYKYIIDLLIQKKYPIRLLSKDGYRYETNFKLSDLNKDQLKYVFDNNKALMYNITDKKAWPYIIEAIIKKEINLNSFDYDIELQLLRFSNNNEIIANELLENAPSREINDQLELLKILKKNEYLINLIRSSGRPLHNMSNIISSNVKVFFEYFGEDVKSAMINVIENAPDVNPFIQLLKLIGGAYPEYIDYLCDILSKGFLKFDDDKYNILLDNKINRDIYKCAPNIDAKERYSYVSDPDSMGNIIVRTGSGLFGVVNKQNEVVVKPIYSELSPSFRYRPSGGDRFYIGKNIDGSYVTIYPDGRTEPYGR